MRCHYCTHAATRVVRYRVHVWTRGWKVGRAGACDGCQSSVGWVSLLATLGDSILNARTESA